MAELTVRLYAHSLRRKIAFELFLPNDPVSGQQIPEMPRRTLFLLHGYTERAHLWIPEELARKYRLAVVMPDGENSFWVDGLSTGHSFGTLLGEELPAYLQTTFGLASSPADTFLMGLSMGGFGAIRTALAYPERFGKAAALSAALILYDYAKAKPGTDSPVANYAYYRECFGEPGQVLQSDKNPEYLAERLLADGKEIPPLYLCCGTEDGLVRQNRAFHRFLIDRGIAHEYCEDTGGHDMAFWSRYAPKALQWMMPEQTADS